MRTVSWNVGGRGAVNMKHENYMCAALINTPKTVCWVPVFAKLSLDSQFFYSLVLFAICFIFLNENFINKNITKIKFNKETC